MKTFKMKSLATAAAVVAMGLGIASSAHALQYNVTLYDVSSPTNFKNWTIVDETDGVNTLGDGDDNPLAGIIALNLGDAGGVPAWLTAGTGYGVTGSLAGVTDTASSSFIYTSSSLVNNGTGTTVRAFVVVSDDGNTAPRNMVQETGSGTFSGDLTGANISLYYYDDPLNGLPISTPLADKAAFDAFATSLNLAGASGIAGNKTNAFAYVPTSGSESFSFNDPLSPLASPDTSTFAMSLIFDFTLANGGQLISRGQSMTKTEQVPEPMTMSLLGAGLIGLGAARRRKAKAKANAEVQAST